MVKLDKNIIEDIFALTPMQEGMLFHYLKEPQNRYYLEQLSLVITGDIDLKCFENAWNVVIETNEMLRTMFRWEKLEHPVQVILKKHQLQWKYFDFSTIIDEANKNENEIERNWKKCLEKIKAKDRDQSFELQQVPFRITLCKIGENRYEMIISNHHILYDGWSNGIILKEFFKAYDDLSKGKEFVKPVKTKFKEFIKWNRNQGVNIDKQEKFWRNYLKGIESRTELSIKRSKGKGKTTVGIENLHVNFKKELKDKIENFVRNYRITLASFLYGVWGLLLQKYNNSYHAVFGTTVSGRSVRIDGIEDMVGLFINTIPLRIRTNPAEKIGDLLHRIDNHLQVREEYEQTSFVDIRKSSEIGSREELFDSIVILENYPLERRLTREHNQLSVGSYSMFERTHYDLTVTVTIFAGIDANIAYNETLFAEDSIARLADHFQCIAREIVEGPEKQVSHLEGITEEEKKQVLYEFNDTAADYPVDKTLHRLLEEHVARTPDRVALLGQTHLTYRELNEKAGHLAHLLQQQGVIPDTIVGIMMERSIEMVIGIMGILKAGGAYLPIEPGYPRERIDYMLGDSKARILVSEVSKVSEVSEGTAVIDLPSLIIENKDTEPTHLTHLTHPTHLCYVLYTSGSTGKPKGVLLEHGAVVNILTALQREYPLRESDGFLFKTPYVFDISVTELFGWFWEGGRLVVLEKDGEKDPGKILDIIEKIGITHINFVPSMFNIFVEALDPQNKGKLSGLKYILLCGEELLPGVIGRLRALNTKITAENIYGPTEAAIYASKYSLDQWENSGFIPIGKPLPNYKIYILDKDGHLQPIGVPGELCIYGDGLARGYLHNLELTAEKFLVSYRSYRTNRTYIPSKKIYKTGDLARWLPDGNIEFLGRMDLQVKIRGFRVELGEIENRLLDHPAVKEAAVIARDDRKGEKYLCAYLVHDEKGVDTRQLKEFLSTRLPDYMIPGYFIPLPGLPLTSSNKINRNALPEPVLKASQGCGPPRNQIEKKLVETWMEVLGRDRDGGGGQQPMIGIDDNFFELGGHSLKAMALMLKIHKEFNVKVSLPEIFDALTIRWLSHHIENKTGEKYVSIEPAPQKDYYALSPAQMRLYLIQQLNQKSTGYNMSWAAALEGDPDYNRLEGVFIRLIDRHESLRTSFHMLAGQPVQRVHENVEFEIEYYSDTGDTGDGEERKQEANRQLPTDFFRPFDLSRAPLLRVGLIKKTGLYHFIIIDMHHIISDGTSMSILTREFVNLYKGAGLPILKLRYKDFSEWQNRRLGSGKLKRQEEYWLSHLSGELPILNMPFDYPRPTVQGFDGDRVHYQLEGQLTRDLNALAGETGTTLYMVLLAAYNLLVRGYTGQEDIIIGTPIAGRTHADLENVIGLFLETLAIRSYPRGERYFNHFLEEIKNTTLTAYENQDYPFRELIKKKADINNLSRNPIFDVMLNVLNQERTELKMEGVRVIPVDLEPGRSKVDLTVEAMEVDDQIILHFEYCTALFSRNTIERLTGHFVNILENLVHHPHMRISEIELLSAKEKLQILEEFNTAFSEPIRNETFIEGFEKQVKNTPDRVALIGQMHLTYRELKEKSTRLACLLREKGVEADVIVGIMVERTVEMIIGILGILKAGGAYMPIDPEYPEERVNYMLADSNVGILLSGVSEVSKVSKGIELVSLSELNEEFPTHLTHLIHPTHLCYIIYTSGSTGKPKGVMVNHKNLVSYLDSFEREFKITVDDVVLQQASYSFDAFVEEVFPCLLKGGKIALPSRDRVRDTALLVDFISANKISMIDCSPLLLSELNRSCPVNAPGVPLGQNPLHTVHTFISGGDVLKSEYIGNLIKTGVVYNTYGPTETTVCASYHKLSGEEQSKIPIGKPITNYRVYILNRAHRCLPIGVPGELCISGLGVTRGYLNQPELTAEKFDHDLWDYQDYHDEKKATLEEQLPGQHLTNLNKKFLRGGPGGAVFSKSAPPGRRRQKIYKTGDLGRWLSDGSIEFLGRIDRQVNIRGFRIELEEIERQLQTHEDIHETAVTAIGASSICAYFTAGKEKNPKELRRFLSLKLPDYMIPAYFVQLDQLPLTPRGKIDTRTLPEPGKQRFTGRTGYKAPGSELEKKLADIWQELLGLEGIGIEDDFFELGGDSLLANQCIARIREELEIELSLRKFFENPCIESLVKVSEPGEVGVPRLRPMPKEGKIPLSFSQERLWFLQCLDPGSMAYYVPRVIRIKGEPDIELVERVITEIIRRHEILRTVFPTTDGEAVQRIREPYAFQLPIIDFSGLSEEEQGKKVSQWLEEEGQRGFNFQDGPMMRITLLKVKEKEYILVLTEHHLIHDGWTQEVLLKEFIILFTAYSQGKPSPLAELPIQYADFAIWQRNHLKGEVLERHLDYWKNKLSGLAPVLELPADRPRPAVISGKGAMKDIRLSRELSDSLRKYSKERGTTLFMTMLAVFKVLVYRYTGCEDICVGTGAANRKHKELEGMLGMLINTLALRTFVTGDLSFEACRERVKTTCMEAYEHEDTPFEKVVEVIRPERSLSYTPIFQVIFSFMDIRGVEIVLPGLELQAEVSHNRSSKFDINVVVVPPLERTPGNENEPGEILIEWEYSTDLFDAETIDRMIGHYNRLLEEIIRRPTVPIAVLPMLAQEEIERLLYAFNDTRTGYPGNMPIHSLFELQAEKTPDYIALHGEGHITYGELNDKSDRLAHLLREKGVQPDTIVGMMMKHSIEMIAGMMGILKAGGAYLPIDPEYPEDRIDYMLTDSNARILVSEVSEVSEVSKVSEGTEIVNLSELSEEFPTHLTHLTHPTHLCYVIYTSGTTGRPRGVGVNHPSLVNLCFWHNRYYNVKESDNAAKFAGIGFDASVWEIFPYLIKGASLHIISDDIKLDMEKLNDYYEKQNITIGFLPTQYCEQFISMERPNRSLRVLLTGGDRLRVFRKQRYELYNNYGPTENTVVTTACLVEDGSRTIPIGKPIDNNNVYILSKNSLQPQPRGAAGELVIAGDSLARGYINAPELTAEKFVLAHSSWLIADRREKKASSSGELPMSYELSAMSYLYKTGDLARWLADGNIEFLGRLDHQVKIRGYRIELGEIENRLLEYGPVKEAVVIDQVDAAAGKYLSAYIVAHPEPEPSKLREWLSLKLPSYMIPSFITSLGKIPLTSNGKIDRNALPAPIFKSSEHFTAPGDEIEKKLARIWSEVMGIEEGLISVEANFFELGGHSLKATLMTAKIHKAFHVKLPLAEVFKTPSIRGLAGYIKNSVQDRCRQVPPAEKKEYYIQSSAQQRLYFLQQMDMDSIVYNIPDIILLNESIDIEKLEKTFKKMTARHESLRTSFHTVDDQPVQKIHNKVDFKVEYFDFDIDRVKVKVGSFIRPFDLSRVPLLRVGLTPGPSPILVLDIHHIICDGISMNLLRKEFTTLYEDKELPDLRIQYKDYAEWQNSKQQKEFTKKQEEYWIKKFKNRIPVLNLPEDYPRPVVQSYEGDRITFEIGKENRETLKKIARWQDTTLFMVLVAIFKVFLSKLSGQEDIIIGIPTAGRGHADLENIIGMFVNTLALRNYPTAAKTYPQFLEEVKIKTLEAFENQDYQFEDLVNHPGLDIRRDPGRNPLFDVMFAFRDRETPQDQFPFKSMPPESGTGTSKFDLTLNANEIGETLHFTFEYCTRLFKKETINRFTGYFKNIVSVLVENHKIKISDIEIVPREEKRQILYEFNDTGVDYPKARSIIELFEEQVEQRPHRVALLGPQINTSGQMHLTYRELNEKSDQLAQVLKGKGVTAERIAAIMVERSVEMIIGLLGILKAGGAYLPIDADYPQERIDYMLKDSNAAVLLTNLPEGNHFHHSSNQFINHHSGNLAYIIYTSGSTGSPKGVMVEHGSVVRLVKNTNYVQFREGDRILQTAPLAFDASTFEIWGVLLNGLTLFLTSKEEILVPGTLKEMIYKYDIAAMWMTSPLFNQMVQNDVEVFAGLSNLLVGGDVLSPSHIHRVKKRFPRLKIINGYGPTENTTFSTTFSIEEEYRENIPIGKPIANSVAYIVDKNGQLQPIGVPGELYVGGGGVARGYLNNPELTAEKFERIVIRHSSFVIRSLQSSLKTNDQCPMTNDRLYRTGDLARWLPDGNIEFLGRMDFQVKIRGFRVEPGEIEALLLENDEIKEAVVIDGEKKSGGKYLCTYFTAQKKLEVSEVREYLGRQLPGYMIPSYFTQLEKMPLTPNGKIDRKRLRSISPGIKTGKHYVAPKSDKEKIIAALWKEILELDRVGRDDNFFDLGGNSLDTINVSHRLKEEFVKDIPIIIIFRYPTIRSIAAYLDREEDNFSGKKKEIFKAIDKGKNKRKKIIEKRKQRGVING